jgi:FAD/FMN-containing dehydrogenase
MLNTQMSHQSWGCYPPSTAIAYPLEWRGQLADRLGQDVPGGSLLAYGNGRSYGDVCLNDGGTLLLMKGLDRLLSFSPETGVLHAEGGVTLAALHALTIPHGWFIPVTPGTQFVTLAGAVANDVHGKNHHVAGTFGCHVLGFTLHRSDGQICWCSPSENTGLFAATIAGLGLTGIISDVKVQLKKIPGALIRQESLLFHDFKEFFALSQEAEQQGFEYTVSWIDCLHPEGRGVFFRGNHLAGADGKAPAMLPFPITPPVSLMNRLTLQTFNTLYYSKAPSGVAARTVHWRPFFYPLDRIGNWNRLYGKKGFLQHQCVLPVETAPMVLREMLSLLKKRGAGSFLAVLKQFGAVASPGLLSFPKPGITLALDFPFQGAQTLELFALLNRRVSEAGGRLYPAKDATMTAAQFQQGYPAWEKMQQWRDTKVSSGFWRRVTET